MRTIVEGVEEKLPATSWPVYTGSNHDAGRLATRWAGGDTERARVALMMLLTLRGTPFLYYGDEIGLPDVELDPADALDPVAQRTGDPDRNRDRYRTPMQWADEPGGGFTAADAEPWLPLGDTAAHNVAAQRDDRGSTLHFTRDLIALRREAADLTSGTYETLPAPDGVWAYRRGDGHVVVLNLGERGGDGRGRRGRRRDRHRPGARRRGGERDADRGAFAGRRRQAVGRARRAPLRGGLGLRVDAPGRRGRSGALPRAVRPRLADHRAAGAARAARGGGGDAARARRAAGAARRPGGRRAAGQDPPRVAAAGAGLAHRARLAGARRRAALLRLGRLDAVVPRGARRARRRRAERRARARLAGRRRVARAGAGRRRRARPLRPARAPGRAQPAGLARRHGPGERGRATAAGSCGPTARRRSPRSPTPTCRRSPTRRCGRSRRCPARRRGSAARRRWPRGSRPTSAPA